MPFATLYAARVPWSGDREANAGLDGQRVGGHGAVLRRSQAVRRPLPRSNPRSGWAPLPRSLGLPTGALLAGLGSMGDFTGRAPPIRIGVEHQIRIHLCESDAPSGVSFARIRRSPGQPFWRIPVPKSDGLSIIPKPSPWRL